MRKYIVLSGLIIVYTTTSVISVKGFTAFLNDSILIYAVGISLEAGKLISIFYIHGEWEKSNLVKKSFYVLIILILMPLTSLEVLGYISQQHEVGTRSNRSVTEKIKALETEEKILKDQIRLIEKTIGALPAGYVSRRISIRRNTGYERKVDRLLEIYAEKSKLKLTKIGNVSNPVYSSAKILGKDPGTVSNIIIVIIVTVLEFLSLALAMATSTLWKERNKELMEEKGIDEYNIQSNYLLN